jgi:4-diphosphocytidyl-2-C-methyl-D-erythritol kinase
MREIRVPAFAKINLRLDILGKRTDGYHELRTIFQTISLHDELRFGLSDGSGIALNILGNDALSRKGARENLVYRAVARLRNELKIRSGVRIELHKRIPVGAGLGGGSSDAAAALRGYLRFTRKRLEQARLLEIASSLGADVPFFLLGGRALGVNRGDEIYPLADIRTLAVLVVVPRGVQVATPDAFRWLKAATLASAPRLTKTGGTPKLWEFCALCWSTQGSGLSNDFERPVFRRHPRLAIIKRALLRAGAAEASLAGSGSAVFGVFPSPTLARRAAVGFSTDQTFVCETISRDKYLRLVNNAPHVVRAV